MIKFKFRLESVLKYRKSLESIARKEYSEAKDKVKRQMDKIKSMYDLIDKTRFEISNSEREGGGLSDISMRNNFINGQKTRIETERFKVRALLAEEESTYEAFLHATREKKILEILKDKEQAKFKKEKSKKEQKINDELVSLRFKRSQAL